jgi:hypothetical protein
MDRIYLSVSGPSSDEMEAVFSRMSLPQRELPKNLGACDTDKSASVFLVWSVLRCAKVVVCA